MPRKWGRRVCVFTSISFEIAPPTPTLRDAQREVGGEFQEPVVGSSSALGSLVSLDRWPLLAGMDQSNAGGARAGVTDSPRSSSVEIGSTTTRLQRRHFTSTPRGVRRASRLPQAQRQSP